MATPLKPANSPCSKCDRPPFAWADRRNPIPFWCFALVVWAIAFPNHWSRNRVSVSKVINGANAATSNSCGRTSF